MATTLGVAVAAHHVALVLVEQRRTGTVTLDQVVLDADVSTTAPADAAAHMVLAEVERITAILDAHKRPLSRVAVAAVIPATEPTAVEVVEALTEAGLVDASLVAGPPRAGSFAMTHMGNPGPPIDAALTAAQEIALEALALVPDGIGRALGGGRLRPVLALAATALATIGVGLIGFRSLSDHPRPEPSPVEATNPVPAQITQRATTPPPPAPVPAVSADTSPSAAIDTINPVPATVEQPAAPAPSTATPTPAPTVESLPTSSEIGSTPPDGAPLQVPQEPPQQPPPPTDQPPPGPVPPVPADPQASQTSP